MLVYIRSVLAGLAAMVLAVALVLCAIVAAIVIANWRFARDVQSAGSAGIGAVSVGLPGMFGFVALALLLVAFVVGFRWQFRRARQAR